MKFLHKFIKHVITSEDTKKDLYRGSILGFILFVLYLEISPKLGNIWYRYDSTGVRTIQVDSFVNYITYPFKNSLLWKPENWDLNFITVSGLVGLGYTLLRQGLRFRKIQSDLV